MEGKNIKRNKVAECDYLIDYYKEQLDNRIVKLGWDKINIILAITIEFLHVARMTLKKGSPERNLTFGEMLKERKRVEGEFNGQDKNKDIFGH